MSGAFQDPDPSMERPLADRPPITAPDADRHPAPGATTPAAGGGPDATPAGADLVCYMPVYKPGPHFDLALRSLGAATIKPYVVAVDDGNTPPVEVPFDRYGLVGEVVRLATNSGVAAAANAGIRRALELGARYVARLDADDLARPERFRRELAYLDAHPDKLAVFTSAEVIDADGTRIGLWRAPEDDGRIGDRMIRNNALCHSSGLFRRAFFERYGLYDPAMRNAEDYALLLTPCLDGVVGTLDEVLTDYRVHADSLSFGDYRQQLRLRLGLQARWLPQTRARGLAALSRTAVLYAGSLVLPTSVMAGVRRRLGLNQFGT